MIYLRNSGFLFGAITRLPFIAGFVLIVRPTSWTIARNLAGKEFLVEQWPFGFFLHPIVSHGRFPTRVGEQVIKVMNHSLPAPQPNRRTTTQDKPKVVCLCGSSRFYEAYQQAEYAETMEGRIYLSIGFYPHCSERAHGEGVGHNSAEKVALDELHKRKIDLADEVYVLNVGGYIGDSTKGEVAYARAQGKPVRWLEPNLAA